VFGFGMVLLFAGLKVVLEGDLAKVRLFVLFSGFYDGGPLYVLVIGVLLCLEQTGRYTKPTWTSLRTRRLFA
jgi:hypothetical protein